MIIIITIILHLVGVLCSLDNIIQPAPATRLSRTTANSFSTFSLTLCLAPYSISLPQMSLATLCTSIILLSNTKSTCLSLQNYYIPIELDKRGMDIIVLVSRSQTFPTLQSSSIENFSSVFSPQPLQKSMLPLSSYQRWLVGPLHK